MTAASSNFTQRFIRFIIDSYRDPKDPFEHFNQAQRDAIKAKADTKLFKKIGERLGGRYDQRGTTATMRGLENAYIYAGSGAFFIASIAFMGTFKQSWVPFLFLPSLFVFYLCLHCLLKGFEKSRLESVAPKRVQDEVVEVYEQIEAGEGEWRETLEKAARSNAQRFRVFTNSIWGQRAAFRMRIGLGLLVAEALMYCLLNPFV